MFRCVAFVTTLFAVLSLRGSCDDVVALSAVDYAGVQFSLRGISPPTAVTARIVDGLHFFNNSNVRCAQELLTCISGPGWFSSLVTSVTFFNASNVSASSVAMYQGVTLTISGDSRFDGNGTYELLVPPMCLGPWMGGQSPSSASANFSITQGRRSPLGRASTFVGLLAGGVGLAAALLGSSTPLLLTQWMALMASFSSAPVPVLEEFEVLQYVLVPFDYRPVIGDLGLQHNARLLFVAAFILCVACGIEFIRFVVEEVILRSPESMIDLDAFGLPITLQSSAAHDSAADELHLAQSSNAGAPEVVAGVAVHSSMHGYRQWPMPPYLVYVCMMGLILSVAHFGTWSATNRLDGDSLAIGGVAVVSIAAVNIGSVGLSMNIGRQPLLFWWSYHSMRGGIPRFLQPLGTWCPNYLRRKQQSFVGAWRKGCKGIAPFVYLILVVVGLLSGWSPDATGNSQIQLGLANFLNGALALILVVLRPFRSPFANVVYCLASVSVFTATIFVSRNSGLTPPDGPSLTANATGLLFTSAIGFAITTVAGLSELMVRTWELRQRRELRVGEDGESQRRIRLQQATSPRAAMLEKQQFQELVQTMMVEVAEHYADASGDGNRGRSGTASASKRSAAKRKVSVWRSGHHEVVVTDDQPPSLAEYLVQDFDAMPLETREELLVADETSAPGAAVVRSMQQLDQAMELARVSNFVHHKSTPCLATLSVEVNKNSRLAKPDYDL